MNKSLDVDPAETLRGVVDACSDCDTCRFLMDESCLLFPELYRLYDKEKETGDAVKADDLHQLAQCCTLCGLCPCPDIRADVIRGRSEQVRKQGMPLPVRLLADVQRFGRWGSLAPAIINKVLAIPLIERLAGKLAGIHPRHRLPRLGAESFFAWARKQGLDREAQGPAKAAYFAGCTAGYLFPEVARAAVAVLRHNGIDVHVPEQQCCGMPTLLEGDEQTTLERVAFNLKMLLKTARSGHDLVCSCPTCGYLYKILLKEKACFSPAYQRSVNAGADELVMPGRGADQKGCFRLKKSMYAKILKDDGYFSGLDPMDRIALAETVVDMGEYLSRLHRENRLNTRLGELRGRMVYYAPCHQREQGIGTPYLDLLARIPGLTVRSIGGSMDCCGMGGSMGFKKNFHDASVRLGTALINKIRAAEPEAVITDCLSCRLQFRHLLPFPVLHPLEVLSRSYATGEIRNEVQVSG